MVLKYKFATVGFSAHAVDSGTSSDGIGVLTGSPGVWMFEGECETVVYGCQPDDRILYYDPVCVLQPRSRGTGIKLSEHIERESLH